MRVNRWAIAASAFAVACVSAVALERAYGTMSALGDAIDASLGRYGVVGREANGKLTLLAPSSDTCEAACDGKEERKAGVYAYYDEECRMGGFGCNFGKSMQCRACQTAPYTTQGALNWHYVQCPQCVCDTHHTTGCNVCVSKYKYYRFQVKTTRFKDGYQNQRSTCEPGITQFSEIKLYTNSGVDLIPLDSQQSKVLEGTLCRADQGPNAATDGSLNTKMCDRDTINKPNGLNFVFAAQTPMQFTHYEIFTAEDCEGRDPTSWTLYGSRVSNTGPWTELSSKRVDPTKSRQASYGKLQVC